MFSPKEKLIAPKTLFPSLLLRNALLCITSVLLNVDKYSYFSVDKTIIPSSTEDSVFSSLNLAKSERTSSKKNPSYLKSSSYNYVSELNY